MLCQFHKKPPDNTYKAFHNPLTKFYNRPSLLFGPGNPLIMMVLISPITLNRVCHICADDIRLWAVVVCRLPPQTKVVIIPINTWPGIIENIVITCHLKSAVFERPAVLAKGYVSIGWSRSHPSGNDKKFPSESRSRSRMITSVGCRVSVCMAQRHFLDVLCDIRLLLNICRPGG